MPIGLDSSWRYISIYNSSIQVNTNWNFEPTFLGWYWDADQGPERNLPICDPMWWSNLNFWTTSISKIWFSNWNDYWKVLPNFIFRHNKLYLKKNCFQSKLIGRLLLKILMIMTKWNKNLLLLFKCIYIYRCSMKIVQNRTTTQFNLYKLLVTKSSRFSSKLILSPNKSIPEPSITTPRSCIVVNTMVYTCEAAIFPKTDFLKNRRTIYLLLLYR